jgi:hypothetical protein
MKYFVLVKTYPASPNYGTIRDTSYMTLSMFEKYSEFWKPITWIKKSTVGDKIKAIINLETQKVINVGDKVVIKYGSSTKELEIKSFDYREPNIFIVSDKFYVNVESIIKKVEKKHLFVTEDNVKVYENDVVYSVNKNNYQIYKNNSCLYSFFTNSLVFASKENAENYVIQNKPCLSLNDIDKCILLQKNIKELVETRIKNEQI